MVAFKTKLIFISIALYIKLPETCAILTLQFINNNLIGNLVYIKAKFDVFRSVFLMYLCRVISNKNKIMKYTFKNIRKAIFTLVMLASITGFANNANTVVGDDKGKTPIVLENVKKGNLLSIIDNNGIVLYKEVIKTNGHYEKGFDLNNLPDGDYIFELEKDLEVSVIPFHIALNAVNFDKEHEVSYFKPYVKQEGDLVIISKLASNLEKIAIEIYAINDEDMKLRYSEKVSNVRILEKAFRLEEGNFKIIISSNNKKYTTFINN